MVCERETESEREKEKKRAKQRKRAREQESKREGARKRRRLSTVSQCLIHSLSMSNRKCASSRRHGYARRAGCATTRKQVRAALHRKKEEEGGGLCQHEQSMNKASRLHYTYVRQARRSVIIHERVQDGSRGSDD